MIINLFFNIVLYYTIGFIGPALATIIASLWSAGYQLASTSKALKQPMRNIFPWKELGFITLANVILGAVFFLIKIFMPLEVYFGNIGEAFALAFIWAIIYLIIFLNKIKQKVMVLKSY